MHISRIDLNLFVVLDAIYQEGNITRASQALKLSQPALSHALGRLRELLKDPLFVRQGFRPWFLRRWFATSSDRCGRRCKPWN